MRKEVGWCEEGGGVVLPETTGRRVGGQPARSRICLPGPGSLNFGHHVFPGVKEAQPFFCLCDDDGQFDDDDEGGGGVCV